MLKKISIFLFFLLIVYQTYSIAFFFQSSNELDNSISLESYRGLFFNIGSVSFSVFEMVMLSVFILLIVFLGRYKKYLKDNFIIQLIIYYCLYQLLLICPLSAFTYSMSFMELTRSYLVRASFLLIPFFIFFSLPAYKTTRIPGLLLNVSSVLLVIAGIWNFFNDNIFITNTAQFRLLWGGSALIFAFVIIDNFFLKKKRFINYFFIAIAIIGFLFTNHRSGFVYFGITLFLGIIITSKGKKNLLFSILILVSVLVLFSELEIFKIDFLSRIQSTSMDDDNAQGRIVNWGLAFDYFLQNPINGSMLKTQYYSSDLKEMLPPHNFIFETLSTQGIVGMFFYIVLLVKSLVIAYKNKADSISFKMFLVLVFYILYSTFNVTFLNTWVLFIMMYSISLILYRDRILKKKNMVKRIEKKLVPD